MLTPSEINDMGYQDLLRHGMKDREINFDADDLVLCIAKICDDNSLTPAEKHYRVSCQITDAHDSIKEQMISLYNEAHQVKQELEDYDNCPLDTVKHNQALILALTERGAMA